MVNDNAYTLSYEDHNQLVKIDADYICVVPAEELFLQQGRQPDPDSPGWHCVRLLEDDFHMLEMTRYLIRKLGDSVIINRPLFSPEKYCSGRLFISGKGIVSSEVYNKWWVLFVREVLLPGPKEEKGGNWFLVDERHNWKITDENVIFARTFLFNELLVLTDALSELVVGPGLLSDEALQKLWIERNENK